MDFVDRLTYIMMAMSSVILDIRKMVKEMDLEYGYQQRLEDTSKVFGKIIFSLKTKLQLQNTIQTQTKKLNQLTFRNM